MKTYNLKDGTLKIQQGDELDPFFAKLCGQTHWSDVTYEYDGEDNPADSFLTESEAEAYVRGWAAASGEELDEE